MEARLVDAGPIKSAVEFLLGTAEDGNSDCVQVLAKLIANNHLLPSITCPFQTPKGRELRVFLQGRGGAGIQAFLEKLNWLSLHSCINAHDLNGWSSNSINFTYDYSKTQICLHWTHQTELACTRRNQRRHGSLPCWRNLNLNLTLNLHIYLPCRLRLSLLYLCGGLPLSSTLGSPFGCFSRQLLSALRSYFFKFIKTHNLGLP